MKKMMMTLAAVACCAMTKMVLPHVQVTMTTI